MAHPGVGAANHTGNSPNPAVDDVVIQGHIRSPEGATKHVVDVLVAEAVYPHRLVLGNNYLGLAILKPLDPLLHHSVRALSGFMLLKLNVLGSLHLGPGVGGEELGAVTVG